MIQTLLASLAFRSSPGTSASAHSTVSVDLGRGLRLHGIQTGTVQVKRAHRQWSGPAAMRIPAIVASRRWTPELPILCWTIEEGDDVFVVDTGETHRVAEPGWFGCDPGTEWFYKKNLRLQVPSVAHEIGPQLETLGVDPSAVKSVVLTHLHSDHAGGLHWFPNAKFLAPRADYPSSTGTLPCRYPPHFKPGFPTFGEEILGDLPSQRLSEHVYVVSTPGHSEGHQSVVVESPSIRIVLAGDASFDEQQLNDGRIAGICQSPRRARQTLGGLSTLCAERPTVYLPSHDPQSLSRLETLQTYRPVSP